MNKNIKTVDIASIWKDAGNAACHKIDFKTRQTIWLKIKMPVYMRVDGQVWARFMAEELDIT